MGGGLAGGLRPGGGWFPTSDVTQVIVRRPLEAERPQAERCEAEKTPH